MALLIRCQQCKRFFSPDNPKCSGCEKPWDVRGSPKAFYVDFTWLGRRRRIRLKAKNLHYAKVQSAEFRPEKWWEERNQVKIEEKRIRFRDAVPDYLSWCEHEGGKRGQNRKATLRSKTTTFANYLVPFFGPKYIDEIQPEDITRFKIEATEISGPRKIRRTPQSINLDLRYLKSFFNWAFDRGYCQINPVTKVSFLEETATNGPPPKLTRDEMHRIEKALHDPTFPSTVRNLIRAWKGLGLRAWNETAKLRWEWFYEEDGIFIIPPGFSKSKKPLVKVLSDEMWSLFRLLKEQRSDSPWIFANPKTGKPYCNLRGSLRRLRKIAGIERHISPKVFRHNFLSQGASDGIPEGQLAGTVGHSNITTTERYIHWFTQERRSIENRIARRLSPADVEQNVEHGFPTAKKAALKKRLSP
ncbi:MAG: tyrosine-type recombinase/integrase [Candidatus Hodarchaeota archaeon]